MLSNAFSCDLGADSETTLLVYLFRNVQNAKEIRNNIVKGEWKCAVIKPSLILAPFQIAIAANKAIVSDRRKTLVTRTVFSEILFNLSLSKNISKSLNTFGIENAENILVCILKTREEPDPSNILTKIKGDMCPINELSQLSDVIKIRHIYKISEAECNSDDLLELIVSKMATKHFVTY